MKDAGNIWWWNDNSVGRSMVGGGMKIVIFHPIVVPFVFNIFSVELVWNCHFIVFMYCLEFSKNSNDLFNSPDGSGNPAFF